MQEETNNILYQRRQNGWSKKSVQQEISSHIKITIKTYAADYGMTFISCIRVVVEIVEILERWVVSLQLRVWVCVCAVSLAALRVHVPVCSTGFGRVSV